MSEELNNLGTLSGKLLTPNYNITFHRDGKEIGRLDFNGPEMTFSGQAEESAVVFFDFIAKSFAQRLKQERLAERERCSEIARQFDVDHPSTNYGGCIARLIRGED